MNLIFGILVLLLCQCTNFVSSDISSSSNEVDTSNRPTTRRIAIIGAGVGGSSAAYHLNKLLKGNVELVVFDENSVIGGRAATVKVFENEYETGASVIHSKNRLAVDLVKELKLREKKDRPGGVISLINNQGEFVFGTSSWTLITIWKIFERYGFDFNRLTRLTSNFIEEFESIYKLQDTSKYYDTVEEMLKAMGPNLYNLTRSNFRAFLIDQGFKEILIDEMVQAITLVNYGQTADMHSLVGSVSVAGAGSSLWSVECGNKHLPIAMLNHTKAKVHLQTKIQAIIQLPDGTLKLSTDSEGKVPLDGNFDRVIIAAPMSIYQKTQPIKFINFANELNDRSKFAQKYHRTVATIVAAKGIQPKYKAWLDILSIEPSFFFTSLSRIYPVLLIQAEKMPVFKVFSPEPLTDEQLNELFEDIKFKHVANWLAYPEYDKVPAILGPFVLHPKIYYLNSIEMAASAMEMSLISGRNAALAISASLKKGKRPSSGQMEGSNSKKQKAEL